MSAAAGVRIAERYRLVRPISSGGMGCVWVARHELLGIDVAIKFLRPDCSNGEAAHRLLLEARAAARLEHPAIVRVFDLVLEGTNPFVVMELLHGESLADLLDREGRIDAIRAVRLLLPVAEALVTAHEHCVIHRDVKPANVYLAEANGSLQPKLIDFGVSRLGFSPRTTAVGQVLGTPEYMAPEQIRARPDVDARVDVWALSVLLYECIAGVPPFHASDQFAVFDRILLAEPTSLSGVCGCDARLWEIIERGLAKDVERRWSSVAELGTELGSWLLSQTVKEDVTGRAVRSAFPLARPDVEVDIEVRPVSSLSEEDFADYFSAGPDSLGPATGGKGYATDNAVELPARSKRSHVIAMIIGALVGAALTAVTLMELDRAAKLAASQPLAHALEVPNLDETTLRKPIPFVPIAVPVETVAPAAPEPPSAPPIRKIKKRSVRPESDESVIASDPPAHDAAVTVEPPSPPQE